MLKFRVKLGPIGRPYMDLDLSISNNRGGPIQLIVPPQSTLTQGGSNRYFYVRFVRFFGRLGLTKMCA